MTYRKSSSIILALLLLVTPLMMARAAGGSLSGTVSDPKGALVTGAVVTVTAPATNQKFTATTDQQGRYKIEGLPAGVYTVTIRAKGFSDQTREGVAVADNQAASLDVKLELAPLAGVGVTVSGENVKGNPDPLYIQLRQRSLSPEAFNGVVAAVNNLVLKRDAATFTLKSGEIYFLTPVEERTVGAVFIGEGEMTMTPPTEIEKSALSVFTNEPTLKEEFTSLVLRFSDKTFEEVKQSPQARIQSGGSQSARARDLYREKESLMRKELRFLNFETRTLADMYAARRPGFFTAFIGGRRWSKLIFMLDPLGVPFVSPEEVTLFSYGESDGGFWTAFHLADEYRTGKATSAQDNRLFDITHHDIEGSIRGTRLVATDTVSFRPQLVDVRVLPFELFPSLRVKSVQDEQGRELNFIQEARGEDADFAVIYPEALEKGKDYKLRIQYDGDGAIRDSGGGNFILIPRSSWYPNNGGTQFGDRATFDVTFHYPKNSVFVGVGALGGPESVDGDSKIAKWTSGQTELAVAGFNYGKFKKKEVMDQDAGYDIEFYANSELPDDLKGLQKDIDRAESLGANTDTTLGAISTTGMADAAIADTRNAVRIYNAYFGKLAYSRIAMTQQPAGNFGQAWPTLVFMPYTAFLDSTQRTQLFGVGGGTDSFWRYVGPHEVAHQWWGHMVGWTSYHDQWMSEGFAEFSTSLYVQFVRKDIDKFIDFWEEQRRRIVEPTQATKGIKPYTIGPVTQGFRLSNSKTQAAYQFLVYPKGAYILHMIRMMMFDQNAGGDTRFRQMMTDFIKSHYNKDVSTEDFKHIIEKYMTPEMDLQKNGRMDWFFKEWVYGKDVPAYKMEYTIAPTSDGKATVNLKITQSNVSDDFGMLVPVYADFGKGWTKLGSAQVNGNSTIELNNVQLVQVPKRLALAAMKDVLATSIENNKK
ncbi:MAG TPA: carboxypeptidase regulatory-like domain-containing protein [Pyrinomonadaceae bacterium]|nr:carboxypeptidase regulatory-like domain-containing protein [Pyrinomonadaceae bacterium]